jgi:ureidoglycolate dehydrogenase (NAD+)
MTFGPYINRMYEDLDRPRKIGHLCIAIDPARFAGAATLESTVDAVIHDVKRRGADILVAGEPERLAEQERRKSGIPIDAEALADMKRWSAKLGVTFPTEST